MPILKYFIRYCFVFALLTVLTTTVFAQSNGENPFGDEMKSELNEKKQEKKGEDAFGENAFGEEVQKKQEKKGEDAFGENAFGEESGKKIKKAGEDAFGEEEGAKSPKQDSTFLGTKGEDAFGEDESQKVRVAREYEFPSESDFLGDDEKEEYGFVEETPTEKEVEKKRPDFRFFPKFIFREELSFYVFNHKSLLNPKGLLDREEVLNRSIAAIDLKVDYKDYLTFIFKNTFVFSADSGGGPEEDRFENFFQEAYLSLQVSKRLFLHAGKENYVGGISYAWNPTDYFNIRSNIFGPEGDNQNQRQERPGTYMTKFELFLTEATIFGIYAPRLDAGDKEFDGNDEHHFYGKVAFAVFKDYNPEFVFNYKRRSSIGVNWSGGITNELVIQFEAAFTKGSEFEIVREGSPIGPPFAPQKTFFFDHRPNRFYVQTVFGINYTFPYNINLIAEYYYNQQGMSNRELKKYNDFLEYCGERAADPRFSNENGDNLYFGYIGQAAMRLEPTKMAQHYCFLRVFKDRFLSNDLRASLNGIVNLQDFSATIAPKMEYTLGEHFSMNASFYFFVGPTRSEFGWIPDNFRCVLEISAIF